jgi:transposase
MEKRWTCDGDAMEMRWRCFGGRARKKAQVFNISLGNTNILFIFAIEKNNK